MVDIKKDICSNIIYNELNNDRISRYIDYILKNAQDNNKLIKIIDLYLNQEDLIENDTLHDIFVDAIEEYFQKSFSKKDCAKYLITEEMKKILKQEISYFNGFGKIEKIIRQYNMSLDDRIIDSYGENIDKEIAEIMHDFDLECSVFFSEYDENLAIEKINERYKNSTIDNLIKNILEKNNIDISRLGN